MYSRTFLFKFTYNFRRLPQGGARSFLLFTKYSITFQRELSFKKYHEHCVFACFTKTYGTIKHTLLHPFPFPRVLVKSRYHFNCRIYIQAQSWKIIQSQLIVTQSDHFAILIFLSAIILFVPVHLSLHTIQNFYEQYQ